MAVTAAGCSLVRRSPRCRITNMKDSQAKLRSPSAMPGKMSALPPTAVHKAQKAVSASAARSEEHTSELQSLMRISYAVFCLKKKKQTQNTQTHCIKYIKLSKSLLNNSNNKHKI